MSRAAHQPAAHPAAEVRENSVSKLMRGLKASATSLFQGSPNGEAPGADRMDVDTLRPAVPSTAEVRANSLTVLMREIDEIKLQITQLTSRLTEAEKGHKALMAEVKMLLKFNNEASSINTQQLNSLCAPVAEGATRLRKLEQQVEQVSSQQQTLQHLGAALKAQVETTCRQLQAAAAADADAPCSSSSAVAERVTNLERSQQLVHYTQLVLHNVPVSTKLADISAALLRLLNINIINCRKLTSRQNQDATWSCVIDIQEQHRSAVILGAAKLKEVLGVVVAPFLTAFGMALRRQRSVHFERLLRMGAQPKWRRGADILHRTPDGHMAYFEFGG